MLALASYRLYIVLAFGLGYSVSLSQSGSGPGRARFTVRLKRRVRVRATVRARATVGGDVWRVLGSGSRVAGTGRTRGMSLGLEPTPAHGAFHWAALNPLLPLWLWSGIEVLH